MRRAWTALAGILVSTSIAAQNGGGFEPRIPKTWVDADMAALEVPLADPGASPRQVSSDYYYRLPVRPIYRSYPIYAPGHEPPGYMEWLGEREPEILWDEAGHRPALRTENDWIRAGEMVFDAAIGYSGFAGIFSAGEARDPKWWAEVGARFDGRGVLPGYRYVIRKKGQVEVGSLACAACHTRVMPDGSVIKGAQGNFPFDRALAYGARHAPPQALREVQLVNYELYAAPWLHPDPQARLLEMPLASLAAVHQAMPPGVVARHRSSPFFPVQVPDLIGVQDRRYLDRTGLQQHRGVVDMMRYAALNQGGDFLADFDGFVAAGIPDFKALPPPAKLDGQLTQPDRYSDEQLYALGLYVYSLRPPPNPNRFTAEAARGERIFQREGCAGCHTPPLYTNNKLTPAKGFTVPPGAAAKYEILPVSVGTDPGLALQTRRGTGYYKVPSLKGVWYRGMFGHSGWCAALEDWLDPRRTREDYVPTGFIPSGSKTYAVQGHPFGLDLSPVDRKALIAFLKTL